MERQIIVQRTICPKSDPKFNFEAFREGWDINQPIGHGETENEALQELISLEG